MNFSFIIALLIFAGMPLQTFSTELERFWHVRNESRLAINGETNVNEFKCEVDKYNRADYLHLYSSPGNVFTFSQNQMVLNLMEFDCGKALITRDFRHTLNAENDPEVIISFLSLNSLPQANISNPNISGIVMITIAGVSKKAEIPLSIDDNGSGMIYLHGKHDFSFTDFGLKPPSKFMGLINVRNELEVTFDLVLEEMPHEASGHIQGRN